MRHGTGEPDPDGDCIKRSAQIRLAEQGRDLLREKMDALIREFFRTMESVSRSRGELEGILALGPVVPSLSPLLWTTRWPCSRPLSPQKGACSWISGEKISWGYPYLSSRRRGSPVPCSNGGTGLPAVSGRIDEVAERYEQALDLVILLAETETALQRLGGEIRMTRRRVNALEQVVIPGLEKQARYIEATIEEREREDIFRLKRVKRIIDRKREGSGAG